MVRCIGFLVVSGALLGCGASRPTDNKPPGGSQAAVPNGPAAPAPDAERLAFLERNIGRFKAGDDMAAVRRGLELERLQPRPHENQPPHTARDDYFFEGFVLIVEHGPANLGAEWKAGSDVLRRLLLVRDGLPSAQRREAYAKAWSEYVRSRSAPTTEKRTPAGEEPPK